MLTPLRICGDHQVWDIRKPNAFERRFTAHEGLVMTICWHPEEKSIIASGGRDRLIKVLAPAMHTDRHATWKQHVAVDTDSLSHTTPIRRYGT